MAQILNSNPTSGPARISQVLPSVKCSNCNASVPLTELGDHICQPAPPLPKPPPSPSSLLPARLQGLVSSRSQSSKAQPAPPSQSNPPPQRRGTPSINVSPSRPGPPAHFVQQHMPGQLSPSTNRNRSPSPLSVPERGPTRNELLQQRLRTGSAANREPPRPFSERERTLSTGLREPYAPRTPPSPHLRTRTPSNDSRASSTPRPSFDSRPSLDSRRPSLDNRRPSFDTLSVRAPPRHDSYSIDVEPPPPPPSVTAPPPPRSPVHNEPDTKIGGEAGMAGVGRRGYFAAAARAAMFTASPHHGGGGWRVTDGMDGRRGNAPRYLDINTAVLPAATPPLSSPNSGYSSHSPGPRSPISPNGSHLSIARSSTSTAKANVPPTIASSRTPSPIYANSPDRVPFLEKFKEKHPTVHIKPPYYSGDSDKNRNDVDPSPLSPSSGSEHGLAYADSTDEEGGELVKRLPTPPPPTPPPPPPPPPPSAPLPISILNQSPIRTKTTNQVRFPSVDDKMKTKPLLLKKSPSASSASSAFSYGSTLQSSVGGRERGNSVSSVSASNYSRSTAKSSPILEKAMETLFEEGSSTTGSSSSGFTKGKSGRSNTVPRLTLSPENKPPKLPTRSLTSPSHATFEEAKRSKVRKRKECVRCEKNIEDGRWIQTDAGGVLCERCWKNMYLPKCRRCNRPIEKQAVSSSDGQLKGKYHRDCFNCHTCHKPFPDKEFYVLDGKPLCAYHYHEANESLCAAATCGQPIEGPCAVSHTGDRYHPEHLLCEYTGCKERLDEYWEADGRMMCEKHANMVEGYDSEDDDEGRWAEGKALKRVTRFIDLAGGLGSDGDSLR